MSTSIKKIVRVSGYFVIPFLSIWLCRVFQIAQGEKNEEIVFGVLLGIVLDFIYGVVFALIKKYKSGAR